MTMPPEQIQVKCPGCGKTYETWRRASYNETLGEVWDEEYLHKVTHGVCPHCGTEVDLGVLIVDRDGVFNVRAPKVTRRRTKK